MLSHTHQPYKHTRIFLVQPTPCFNLPSVIYLVLTPSLSPLSPTETAPVMIACWRACTGEEEGRQAHEEYWTRKSVSYPLALSSHCHRDGSRYARMLESVYRRRGGETGTRRVLNEEISDLLAALHHNMEVRAEVIAERTVAALFMLNNTAYVSNSLASTSMKEAMKQSERLKECELAFIDAITVK
ncbi:unnamed protein product, partial [Closterium sp. NIES-54]